MSNYLSISFELNLNEGRKRKPEKMLWYGTYVLYQFDQKSKNDDSKFLNLTINMLLNILRNC